MQEPSKIERWWYNDDPKTAPKPSRSPPRTKRSAADGDRKWRFQVVVTRDLLKEEKIAVTGDCEALGSWQPHDVVILNPDNGKFVCMDICTRTVDTVPSTNPISFIFKKV